MSNFSPLELRDSLSSGLLSFPVTHATADLAFDRAGYLSHVRHLADFEPAGVFAAGGTGEFFSLTLNEVAEVVRTAVAAVDGRLPVLGAAGYGTALATELAADSEEAGADGILLLPPYLTGAPAEGLYEHVARVCSTTSLGVVVYHRANARFDVETIARLAEEFPNFIAFKDGIGDLELIARLRSVVGDRLLYINGLPTAETTAVAYFEYGFKTYSSAIFNFAPEWALEFYGAARRRDSSRIRSMTDEFLLPYIGIRDRRAGYAVSIAKAGMRAVGRSAGPVRPPLTDLRPDEFDQLQALLSRAA